MKNLNAPTALGLALFALIVSAKTLRATEISGTIVTTFLIGLTGHPSRSKAMVQLLPSRPLPQPIATISVWDCWV